MAQFDTGLPSISQIQGYIKDQQLLELKLLTGDSFSGQLCWQDPNCLCLITQDQQTIMIPYHAIAYLKPQAAQG